MSSTRLWRAVSGALFEQGVLHTFVGFDLGAEQSLNIVGIEFEFGGTGLSGTDDLLLARWILDSLAAVPFAQGNLIGNGQALADGLQQRFKGGWLLFGGESNAGRNACQSQQRSGQKQAHGSSISNLWVERRFNSRSSTRASGNTRHGRLAR